MAYIYQITNDINNKIYIGKTEFSIEKRFKEHCYDAFRIKNEKRPLYAAMRKYGIEHFHIELIEETDNPEEREIYWIEQKRSFKNGYNATLGGDGKKYIDYDLIIAAYKELQQINLVCEKYNINDSTVHQILVNNSIPIISSSEINRKKLSVPINQYDLNNNYIASFSSSMEAARAIKYNSPNIDGVASHIRDVCKGKRKTAYGYIWRFA